MVALAGAKQIDDPLGWLRLMALRVDFGELHVYFVNGLNSVPISIGIG